MIKINLTGKGIPGGEVLILKKQTENYVMQLHLFIFIVWEQGREHFLIGLDICSGCAVSLVLKFGIISDNRANSAGIINKTPCFFRGIKGFSDESKRIHQKSYLFYISSE